MFIEFLRLCAARRDALMDGVMYVSSWWGTSLGLGLTPCQPEGGGGPAQSLVT